MIGRAVLKKFGKGFVLYGHGVVHKKENDFIEALHIDFSDFEKILHYLIKLDYEFIPMKKLIEISKKEFFYHKHWIHLTFDDGYANNLNVILPFLKSKGIPFTLFVTTNHIAAHERFYTYRLRCAIVHTKKDINIPFTNMKLSGESSFEERKLFYKKVKNHFKKSSKKEMLSLVIYIDSLLDGQWDFYNNLYHSDEVLTEEEIRSLSSDEMVTVASHNHNHFRLNDLFTEEEITYEMAMSKKWLEEKLQLKSEITYAYPSGTQNDFSKKSKEICIQMGYKLAFTTLHHYIDRKTELFAIPRFPFPKKLSKMKKIVFASIRTIREKSEHE